MDCSYPTATLIAPKRYRKNTPLRRNMSSATTPLTASLTTTTSPSSLIGDATTASSSSASQRFSMDLPNIVTSQSSTPSSSSSTSKRSQFSVLSARYLLFYNVGMTAGWLLVLLRLIQAVIRKQSVYDAVQLPLKLFQTGAILEIVHALTGLIRSSPLTTAFQVGSRLLLVWGVADPVISVRSNISFTTMVLAWSLTEIPRYFYFTVAALTDNVPFWVTLARYSTFIPLYPLGAGSEWLTLFSALPYIEKERPFSIYMPNKFNIAFDYYVYCVSSLLLYAPGLPYMYSHMLHQRRKYVSRHYEKLKTN